jgi:exodeoxyribonuclease V alpha subunit
VGLTVYREGQLSVCFETTDAAGHIGHRYVSPRELPEHDLGYALTIHQSQGSEYAHVAVLLPAEADHRILSRQLLYTGVSRAKRSIEIWSSPASLRSALDTVSLRHGGLRQRLTAASIGEEKAL